MNKKTLAMLCAICILAISSVGLGTFAVIANNQKQQLAEQIQAANTDNAYLTKDLTEQRKEELANYTDTESKVVMADYIDSSANIASLEIEAFSSPVSEEWRVSSKQGLRDKISGKDTGGLATSGKWHNGIDIACPDKTPVYATKDGVVTEVWPSYYNGPYNFKGHPIYGGLVVISHPDHTISLYAHLSLTSVYEGDKVKRGQEIGWSGGVKNRRGSGSSTGAHLHYSMYLDMNSDYFMN